MPPRTSTRLAKKKGKLLKVDTDEIHDDIERDSNFVNDESENEDQAPPPRKRQRAAAKSGKKVIRKKQVRGKQGGLAGLINMPIDIFTEIASHLLPIDIINLARSNKFFRSLLMHRSSLHIWNGAMRNVEGLPSCPPAMSEPRYLSLMFSKTCTECGAPARSKMDPNLLVRLCGPCRSTQLMALESVPSALLSFVYFSGIVAPPKRRSIGYVLREDIRDLLVQYEGKKKLNDPDELEKWTNDRKELVAERQDLAQVLRRFLITLEFEREQELGDAKEARRSEIKRRLAELGWSEQDMDFGWWSDNQRAWHDLVSQVKPLTDRIWTNIQPKLIPLLETNRQQRLEVEREKRQSERRRALSKLFLEMKEQSFPALRFNAHNPVARLSSSMPTIRVIYQEPFPDFSHALNWPLIKDLYETDVSATEMEAKFSQHRDEILALVTEWKGQIQSQLVSLLRTALDDKDETPRPTISISNEEPNPLANVSDDTKLLLRADSLFHNTTPPMVVKQPLTYGSILSWKDLMESHSLYGSSIAQTPPNFDNIRWYAEAHEVAREILADLGKPDASYLEMKSVGSVFVCGRCHETSSRTWEAMVQHYVEHKRIYAELQKDGSPLSEHEITYRNVHDPQLFTDRPMITDFATKTLENESSLGVGRSQLCKLCEKIPATQAVIANEAGMWKHLSDVHEITEPKVDEHYTVRSRGAISFDTDDYDSDDSYYMGHGGCNCPFHQMFGGPGYGDGYGYSDEDDDGFGLGFGFGYDDEDEDEDGYGLGSDEDYL